jgi:hypothetical protein
MIKRDRGIDVSVRGSGGGSNSQMGVTWDLNW